MTRPRIYVDTNVHYPYYVSDLFGFLATYSLVDLLWSDYLVNEVLEKVPSVARTRQWDALRRAFPECAVTEDEWRRRMSDATGPDPDDHPHQAAAMAGGADVLVSNDRRGFPAGPLAVHGVRVQTADEFLCDLLDAEPLGVTETLIRRAGMFRNPAMTLVGYLEVLARSLPAFADAAADACGRRRGKS